MQPDFWLNIWEKNEIPFHHLEVRRDLVQYFPLLKLKKGSTVFVPFCGKSLDMLWFLDQGYRVIGVELSRIACEQFFAELNLQPKITEHSEYIIFTYQNLQIFCGDLFDFEKKHFPTIDAIYDCSALIALPEESRQLYVSHLKNLLDTQGQFFLITIDSDDKVKGPPFPVSEKEVRTLFSEQYAVNKISSKDALMLPENLIRKGYKAVSEKIYFIFVIPTSVEMTGCE